MHQHADATVDLRIRVPPLLCFVCAAAALALWPLSKARFSSCNSNSTKLVSPGWYPNTILERPLPGHRDSGTEIELENTSSGSLQTGGYPS
mmetsp:Transcript_23630/g.52340  ORF Transcript_23630/g.52340 Transcript_23630/m.52340 type:complete len:91 (-) Transcript_23630:595-867(-)